MLDFNPRSMGHFNPIEVYCTLCTSVVYKSSFRLFGCWTHQRHCTTAGLLLGDMHQLRGLYTIYVITGNGIGISHHELFTSKYPRFKRRVTCWLNMCDECMMFPNSRFNKTNETLRRSWLVRVSHEMQNLFWNIVLGQRVVCCFAQESMSVQNSIS